jgi:hypothetical protein
MAGRLTQRDSGCSGSAQAQLTLSSGKSGRCSGPETKTEAAKEKVKYDYCGNLSRIRTSIASYAVSTIAALLRRYSPSPHPLLGFLSHVPGLPSIN